ncbi:hypothetical protein ACVME8_005872 [Bradyrhizobium diazoefficiens]
MAHQVWTLSHEVCFWYHCAGAGDACGVGIPDDDTDQVSNLSFTTKSSCLGMGLPI